jgi:hypothetical protein
MYGMPQILLQDKEATMTAGTLARSTRSTSGASQAGGSWPTEIGSRRAGGLPPAVAGWSLTRIAAGWWLSDAGQPAPAVVSALLPEPERPAFVIDADGPDERTDRLLRELTPALSSAGVTAVRLVLSSAGRYARAPSYAPGIDLITADGPVVITPHGYALVRSAGPVTDRVPPQWCRRRDGGCEPAGVLAPSPGWERGLADVLAAAEQAHGLRLRRVPAGLAIAQPARDAWLASAAQQVWPDPERPTIVIDGIVPHETIHHHLAGLLSPLARYAAGGIRLHWPRAGVAGSAPSLQQLAAELGVDLIVPAADVSAREFGGICHGPSGAAPWLQFGRDGSVSALGSMYPEPAWERALAETALAELPADVVVEDIATGLCVYRPGPSMRGLSATARSILPEPDRMTIVAGGDAGAEAVKQDVAAVFGRLPAKAAGSVRLLLAGAASGGQDSYAQGLADAFGCEIVAPVGRWTATPDGRVRALAAPGAATGPEAGWWRTFRPRRGVDDRPRETLTVEPPPKPSPPAAPAAPAESPQTHAEPSEPPARVPAAPSAIVMLPRDHRSTAAERMAYRESATEFQTHSVFVRRMMTQRPGLRSAAAGEAMEVVATDFTAVLDFLSDDRQAVAAELRSTGTAKNPRMACVLSGLRRLPSFTGAVFSSARLPSEAAAGYTVGSVLMEPAFVEASSSQLVAMQGGVEYVIWSQTGKRMAALAAGAGRDEVIFAAGTSYRVLRVDPATSGAGRLRVFLRELAISVRLDPASSLDETDHRVLERLVASAALRDGAAAGDQMPAWRPGALSPIGLDDRGLPFSETLPSR